jgi:hypothetical protein
LRAFTTIREGEENGPTAVKKVTITWQEVCSVAKNIGKINYNQFKKIRSIGIFGSDLPKHYAELCSALDHLIRSLHNLIYCFVDSSAEISFNMADYDLSMNEMSEMFIKKITADMAGDTAGLKKTKKDCDCSWSHETQRRKILLPILMKPKNLNEAENSVAAEWTVVKKGDCESLIEDKVAEDWELVTI